jgi:hypothetical protein
MRPSFSLEILEYCERAALPREAPYFQYKKRLNGHIVAQRAPVFLRELAAPSSSFSNLGLKTSFSNLDLKIREEGKKIK